MIRKKKKRKKKGILLLQGKGGGRFEKSQEIRIPVCKKCNQVNNNIYI